jgi:hypothetical protein
MSSMRVHVLLWAQRIVAMKGGPAHVLLEVAEDAAAQQIQDAFHKIARTSHPDLFRNGLDAQELELVTSAYAVVAGAYQHMRTAAMQTQRLRPLASEEPMPPEPFSTTSAATAAPSSPPPRGGAPTSPRSRVAAPTPVAGARAVQASPSDVPAKPSGLAPATSAAQSMSPKALLYFRKAELCLKRGDLRGAILQLKLACASDPTSGFLRTALAEVEAEVRAKT